VEFFRNQRQTSDLGHGAAAKHDYGNHLGSFYVKGNSSRIFFFFFFFSKVVSYISFRLSSSVNRRQRKKTCGETGLSAAAKLPAKPYCGNQLLFFFSRLLIRH